MPDPIFITSSDNALVKFLARLAQHPAAYRKQGQIWLEGDHLCAAALVRAVPVRCAVFSASMWAQGVDSSWYRNADKVAVVADAILIKVSPLPSSASMGYVVDCAGLLLAPTAIDPEANTVILDRIQDAGNVGSILRSASALGFKQVLALQGTAVLWSPKVLRAGMGAHFGLRLFEGCTLDDVRRLQVPRLVTHLQGTTLLHQTSLPQPCAWIFGHEGQGVASALVQQAELLIRIAQPGGEESLNVAAAAAICLHASATAR